MSAEPDPTSEETAEEHVEETVEELDPGYRRWDCTGDDPAVLAQMLRTVNRFDRDEIPLPAAALPAALEFFSTWARELS